MKRTLLIAGLCMAVCSCSGLEIRSLDGTKVSKYFVGSSNVDGYIVYEPMTVVEIAKEPGCEKKDEDGNCIGAKRCKVGEPFYLPNYKRPYSVKSKTGFGKAGVDVTINNGWQLGAIKDESDNSAVLTFAKDMVGLRGAGRSAGDLTSKNQSDRCPSEGLYRLVVDDASVLKLTRLKSYELAD